MSRLDTLPADQQSVLQLLLRQGKGYGDLSELLKLEPPRSLPRTRRAGHTGPRRGGPPAERRREIGDWLLGQQSPDEAVATRAFIDGSPAGRTWAHGVARELEPLAGDRLPELPAEGAVTDTTEPSPRPPPSPPPPPPPRASRAAAARFIGGLLAAIAVAVVLVIVLTGGKDNKDDAAARPPTPPRRLLSPRSARRSTSRRPRAPPPRRRWPSCRSSTSAARRRSTPSPRACRPPTRRPPTAIWAYTSPSQAKLVGGFDKKDDKGHLVYQGAVPKDVNIADYKEILVTLETSGNPTRPGTIYLRGPVQSAAGG